MSIKDITGEKFYSLTAVRFIELRGVSRTSYWLFKCDCGNEKIIRASAVKYGTAKSCGCLMRNDISGKRYGKLVAIKFSHIHNKMTYWVFCCDCGNITTKSYGSVVMGGTKSCGCIVLKHGMYGTPEYNVWHGILQRCKNKNNKDYKNYGGRGISICKSWYEFKNFYADMGNRPKGKTIDRIDNNGNYDPVNCRWATTKEQSRNKRTSFLIEYNGEIKCCSDWAKQYNLHRSTLGSRILKGWSFEKAVGTPVRSSETKIIK